ncbi:MAG: LysE family translocator [Paracoccaceae bacterium]
MPSFELFLAFLAATAVFAYMPGPSMLYTAAQTLARGRRGGLMAALGLHLGGYAHVIAAALGISALFHAAPSLYLALKIAGAAYLVWLGLDLLRRRAQPQAALPAVEAGTGRRAFLQSVVVEVLNPKTAIFYIAFLPQFTDPAAAWSITAQLMVLGVIVNVMFSSADLFCVALAGAVVERFRRSGRAQRVARMVGGMTLIGLGTNLALQRTS